ncbi:MAG: polyphosphate kinase 1 [Anaerovoracaceae bacterium]|jgi:polyphosphate kinase
MDKLFTQNRELSWLKFNERVLMEAADETVPLVERLKFVSIFVSNLDEFFMIRVGSLFDLMAVEKDAIDRKSNLTPKEQLDRIYAAVGPMIKKKEEIYESIVSGLKDCNVHALTYPKLSDEEKAFLKEYWKENMRPLLSPQIVDTHHPFPHLQNKASYVATSLEFKGVKKFGIVPLPPSLPEIVYLPGEGTRFIKTEDILLKFVDKVFIKHQVLEKTILYITRNADITPDDELGNVDLDFKIRMQSLLKKRARLGIVRLELSNPISEDLQNYFADKFEVEEHQTFITGAPIKMSYVYGLADHLDGATCVSLTYPPFRPQPPAGVREDISMTRQIMEGDILLSYPYEAMDPFLRLVRESSKDENVISIKITIYRLASKAKLVDYLCAAAENGKDVTVLIELRARFDEQNNIDWSDRLEEAGCRIIYGFEDYKVHSKLCLITRKEKGEIKYITQVGTGNYNEKTAALYTDLSLMTANYQIGEDANEFFRNMGIGNLEGEYTKLLVAPVSLKSEILRLIDEEMEKGEKGYIRIKINSFTDMGIIQKLKDASCAGVRVDMIIRGICCILPGISGKTENLHVTSVVGRFLEHSRVYCFGRGEEEKMYISSADFMTRNTERRVEVACPILDESVKKRIREILDVAQWDTVKGRVLKSDGTYEKKPQGDMPLSSQDFLIRQALEAIPPPATEKAEIKAGGWGRFKAFFRRMTGRS